MLGRMCVCALAAGRPRRGSVLTRPRSAGAGHGGLSAGPCRCGPAEPSCMRCLLCSLRPRCRCTSVCRRSSGRCAWAHCSDGVARGLEVRGLPCLFRTSSARPVLTLRSESPASAFPERVHVKLADVHPHVAVELRHARLPPRRRNMETARASQAIGFSSSAHREQPVATRPLNRALSVEVFAGCLMMPEPAEGGALGCRRHDRLQVLGLRTSRVPDAGGSTGMTRSVCVCVLLLSVQTAEACTLARARPGAGSCGGPSVCAPSALRLHGLDRPANVRLRCGIVGQTCLGSPPFRADCEARGSRPSLSLPDIIYGFAIRAQHLFFVQGSSWN